MESFLENLFSIEFQLDAIRAVLEGHDVFVSHPTGLQYILVLIFLLCVFQLLPPTYPSRPGGGDINNIPQVLGPSKIPPMGDDPYCSICPRGWWMGVGIFYKKVNRFKEAWF